MGRVSISRPSLMNSSAEYLLILKIKDNTRIENIEYIAEYIPSPNKPPPNIS